MSTAFDQLAQAMEAKLQEAPALASGNIYVDRERVLPADKSIAINIVSGDSDGQETVFGGAMDWDTQIDIECYARDTSTATAHAAADALLAEVWARLKAFNPAGLGLMGFALEPRIRRDRSQHDLKVACYTVRAVATHRTQPDTLAPWA